MRSHVRPSSRSSAALLVSCLLLALSAVTARPAAADASTCISAHATAQRESSAGNLRLASRLFTACGSDESCPDPLRKECAELLQAVRRALPSVTFSVVDERGGDLSDVRSSGVTSCSSTGSTVARSPLTPENTACAFFFRMDNASAWTFSSVKGRKTA